MEVWPNCALEWQRQGGVVAAMECTGGETKEGKAGAATAGAAAGAAGYSYCVFLQCFRTMCSEWQ